MKRQDKKQIILYFIFGAGTTITNLLIYKLAMTMNIEMTLSNAIAWLGAVLFAFVTNKIFVFESRAWNAGTLINEGIKFFSARVISGIVEIFGPTLLYRLGMTYPLFGTEGFLAKIVVSVLIIIANYVVSKQIVFRTKK